MMGVLMKRVILGGALAGLAGVVVSAAPAVAATHYTHGTDLTAESCAVHENFPKAGVPDRTWTVSRTHDPKHPPVGVRYTYKGYAMVLDHTRGGDPHWGFVAQSCLKDPYAYDTHGTRLHDLRAVGGHNTVVAVRMSASHAGRHAAATITVTSTGSIRDNPRSFATGNVEPHDQFRITTTHCGHHPGNVWILGYVPVAGRWGYVEARHLPACL
jgi:hypothetical protein